VETKKETVAKEKVAEIPEAVNIELGEAVEAAAC
jgi:hypothetical protein